MVLFFLKRNPETHIFWLRKQDGKLGTDYGDDNAL